MIHEDHDEEQCGGPETLACAAKTKNFSGAEIQGLVKSAISWALNRQIDAGDLSKPVDEENLKVSETLPLPEWVPWSLLQH